MRSPWYHTPERVAAYQAEARSWLGTPFRFGSACKGPAGGVDCVGLSAAIHAATGACSPLEFDRLPVDWHLHHRVSGILEFFHNVGRARLQRIEADEPWLNGDLVVLKVGGCEHHLLNWIEDECGRHLLHAPRRGIVERLSPETSYIKSAQLWCYRLLEETT